MASELDEPRFDQLPAFPANGEPELPLPQPWHRRLPGLMWRLFPATIICVPVFGLLGLLCFGLLFVGMMDWLLGLLGGLVLGAVVGIVVDVKHSLLGGTIDD